MYQPIFIVNLPFAASATFASNQAILRCLGSALKKFREEHIATVAPIIADVFSPVITARTVPFIFFVPCFFAAITHHQKKYCHFVRCHVVWLLLFANMIFYISYKYHIYEYCILRNIR